MARSSQISVCLNINNRLEMDFITRLPRRLTLHLLATTQLAQCFTLFEPYGAESCLGAHDFLQDVASACRPDEGFWILVLRGQPGTQFADPFQEINGLLRADRTLQTAVRMRCIQRW